MGQEKKERGRSREKEKEEGVTRRKERRLQSRSKEGE